VDPLGFTVNRYNMRIRQVVVQVLLELGVVVHELFFQGNLEGIVETCHDDNVGQSDAIPEEELVIRVLLEVEVEDVEGVSDFLLCLIEFHLVVLRIAEVKGNERVETFEAAPSEVGPLVDFRLRMRSSSQQPNSVRARTSNEVSNSVAFPNWAVWCFQSRYLAIGIELQIFGGLVRLAHLETGVIVNLHASELPGDLHLSHVWALRVRPD